MTSGSKDILKGFLAKHQAASTEELLNKVCTTPGVIINFCRSEELKLIAKLLEIEQSDNLFAEHVSEYCAVSMCLCESNKEELLLNGAAGSISKQRKMSPFAKMDAEEEMNDTREMNRDLASKPYDVPVEQIALNKVDDYMSAYAIDPLEVTYIELNKTKKPSENSLVLDVLDAVFSKSKNPPEFLTGRRNYTGNGTYEGDNADEHTRISGLPYSAGELEEARSKLLDMIKEDEKRIMEQEEN
ncbi:MAG: hypothetical protein K5869_08885 [Saccharofermentans sp.]|nr:hypothetical protein [Saccharofermentans sp.]